MNKTVLIALSLFAIGVLGRLVPHLPNATPIAAIALLGGMHLGKRWSLFLPIAVLFITDLFIGFYDWRIMASVYASFALTSILMWLARKKGMVTIGFALLASSFAFFLVTNGAVWYFSPWYEKSVSGLLYAYELGLPFFRNMFLGDIAYTAALTLAVALLRRTYYRKYFFGFSGSSSLIETDRKVIHSHTT
jgi:hypothetical protein